MSRPQRFAVAGDVDVDPSSGAGTVSGRAEANSVALIVGAALLFLVFTRRHFREFIPG